MGAEIEQRDPLVLLIGSIDHEGVRSLLSQSGRLYKKKILHSKPRNWQEMADFFESHSITTVLVKLTSRSYNLIADSEYSAVAEKLFSRIALVPHAIYIYEGLYTGVADPSADDVDENESEDMYVELDQYFGTPAESVRLSVNDFLKRHSLTITTYTRNSEVTILAQAFLSHSESGLLLRLYIPNAQLWSTETDKLLQLFREYLIRVTSVKVRMDETRTSVGVIYELHGDPIQPIDVSSEFEEFAQFMNLCVADSDQAERFLRERGVASKDVLQLLTRYAKESKRLHVDMRYEREQRVSQIRHRLESELLDTVPGNISLDIVAQLVDAAVPTVLGPSVPLLFSNQGKGSPGQLTININPQIVGTVNGIVAQEVSGDLSQTTNDQELLRLFAEFAGKQHADLVSALRELSDQEAPVSGRLSAKQKIKSFLLSLGSTAGEVAAGVLQTYLEKKMLGL